ncbi:hypothetical protein [Aquimarina longa]|uniref:hypothetical protein n=1 Tax=Aquimarina longa TaxID=1080221 RepID=UPI000783908D|nr:hypothetical protein [Aquimarina longa]
MNKYNFVNEIDRQLFYQSYRTYFGKIRMNKTVYTINAILERSEYFHIAIPKLAYIFATALHEARHAKYKYDFYPIVERGGWNYIVNQYWHNSKVRRWLGNDTINEAYLYRGRGLVQLTGETNYGRFNLQDTPEKALESKTAVRILFIGMQRGMFTGKALHHYLNPNTKDYYNARRIINGTDKATRIAKNAELFETILTESNIVK